MKTELKNSYMDVAYIFSKLSKAKRLKVGAIIVKDDRILSIGYNGTPSGFDNVCEDENGNTKIEVLHAEANCISKMAKSSESSDGATMFCTHSPCVECAKQIYMCGIKELYYSEIYRDVSGISLLEKLGVKTQMLTDETKIRVN